MNSRAMWHSAFFDFVFFIVDAFGNPQVQQGLLVIFPAGLLGKFFRIFSIYRSKEMAVGWGGGGRVNLS